MLGTLLQSLTSLRDFFSRAFFIGAFLPTLLFAFLNTLALYLWNWPVHNWLEAQLFNEKASHRILVFAVLFISLWIASFLVGALTPLWQRILSGGAWQWSWAREIGVRYQQARFYEIDKGINDAVAIYGAIARKRPTWVQAVNAAATGVATRQGASSATRDIVSLLKLQRLEYRLISFQDLDAAYTHLANEVAALGGTDELQDLAAELDLLTDYADNRAQSEHARLYGQRSLNFGDASDIAPTQFGNVGVSAQAYAMRAYHCSLPLIWGALRQAAQKDEKLAASLDDSKMQLDFLVASFFLFDIWALTWAVVFACYGAWPWSMALALFGPLLGWSVWYAAAVERYRVMQDLMMSLLDSLRFKVLANSHLTTPIDLEEERELWRALDFTVGQGARGNLRYQPEKPAAS